jgi:uncharacterized protein
MGPSVAANQVLYNLPRRGIQRDLLRVGGALVEHSNPGQSHAVGPQHAEQIARPGFPEDSVKFCQKAKDRLSELVYTSGEDECRSETGDAHRRNAAPKSFPARFLACIVLRHSSAVYGLDLITREISMQAKVIHEDSEGGLPGERTFALIFGTGEEVMAGLTGFARDRHFGACHFTAIGAFSDVTLGFFDWEQKHYKKIPLHEQVEVLSLVGDIAMKDGQPTVHAHVVVGKPDGTAHGGHLMEAHVRPTLEMILVESPKFLRRTIDPESGLALIDIGASEGAIPSA